LDHFAGLGAMKINLAVSVFSAAMLALLASKDAEALLGPGDAIRSEYVANQVIASLQNARGGTISASGNGLRIAAQGAISGPGGRTAIATVVGNVGIAGAAGLVVRAALGVSALGLAITAGSALKDFLDDNRISPNPAGGVNVDDGVPQSARLFYSTSEGDTNYRFGSPTDAANYAMQQQFATWRAGWGSLPEKWHFREMGALQCSGLSCYGKQLQVINCNSSPCAVIGQIDFATQVGSSTQMGCSDVDGQSQVPGWDNKCRSGITTRTITGDQAAEELALRRHNDQQYEAALRSAIGMLPGDYDLGRASDQEDEITEVQPQSLPGPTTTKVSGVGSDQRTTSVVTGWNWARDPLRKNTGTWTETKTTTVTDSNGQVISVETEGMTGNTPTDSEGKGGIDCAKNPTAVACANLDSPDNVPLPEKQVQVTFAPFAGFGPDTASCPTKALNLRLAPGLDFSYAMLCSWADMLRFAIIGIALVIASRIVIGGTK
jgi:Neisseria meningitidis TspB protein